MSFPFGYYDINYGCSDTEPHNRNTAADSFASSMFRKVVGSQTSVSRIGNAVRRCATTTSGKDVSQKRDVVGIAFFSGICIVASALGTWQVKR